MLHNPYSNLPTNSDTVTFQYDASGRRLKKTYTSHIEIDGTPHTDVTTYKYHYAGGAITEIELDKVRDSTTTLLDQELIYHIGANSQPISFEWTRHTGTGESQTTTTSTYYYHYDVHGNTLKVTDTNQDTKITYTYDTLGNITSQTNPDSIPNPFTFMGASQTILDTETNLYFSSGYYNPQTGTLLQGTGSPAMPNPTSISTINSMSTSSLPEEQLLSHQVYAQIESYAPSSGVSEGLARSDTDARTSEVEATITDGLSPTLMAYPWIGIEMRDPNNWCGSDGGNGYTGIIKHYYDNAGNEITEREYNNIMSGRPRDYTEWDDLNGVEKAAIKDKITKDLTDQGCTDVTFDMKEGSVTCKTAEGTEVTYCIEAAAVAVYSTYDNNTKTTTYHAEVMCYKLSDQRAQIFWPSGGSNDGKNIRKTEQGDNYTGINVWEDEWQEYFNRGDPGSGYVKSINTSGSNMVILDVGYAGDGFSHGVKIMIGNGVNTTRAADLRKFGNYQFSYKHCDVDRVNPNGTWDINISYAYQRSIFEAGNQVVLYSNGYFDVFNKNNKKLVDHCKCEVGGLIYNWFFITIEK